MRNLEERLDCLIAEKTAGNIFVRVGRWDEILYDAHRGNVNETTLFDMASVTKVYATTLLALIAIDKGLFSVKNTVKDFYPDCTKDLTILNLLTHTIGVGYKQLWTIDGASENVAKAIWNIPCDIPIGENVLYSCPAFILLAKILEKIYGESLDKAFEEYVAKPLGLQSTQFCPTRRTNIVNANAQGEKLGIVNDLNCQFLGGVSGNAGLFSDITDTTKYVKCLLNKGAPLISERTFEQAVKNYTADKKESRGLGFLYVDERYEQTGELFENGAIGHCGHTGQSLFLDYKTGLYVIILSDATISTIKKYGGERYDEVVDMRKNLHNAIKKDLKL